MRSIKIICQSAFICLLLNNISLAQSKLHSKDIRNLVFEGGGIRGIAYAGALMELQKSNMLDSIKRVAGTSAGAIASTLFAVGYTPEEIAKSINDLKIQSMADGKGIFIGGSIRLVRHFGWYKGEEFKEWIGKLIYAKTGKENLTFEELHNLSEKDKRFKELYLTGTDLTEQKLVIFCSETYSKMEVRTAVRISMGIPLFYKAVVLDKEGKVIQKKKDYYKGSVMVDGGILGNFPIHIFDYEKYFKLRGDSTNSLNHQTLGLRLDTDEQIKNDKQSLGLARADISNFKNYVSAFYILTVENLNRQNLTAEDWKRTISISTVGIGPKVRKMSEEEKNLLIESGRKGVKEYFDGK